VGGIASGRHRCHPHTHTHRRLLWLLRLVLVGGWHAAAHHHRRHGGLVLVVVLLVVVVGGWHGRGGGRAPGRGRGGDDGGYVCVGVQGSRIGEKEEKGERGVWGGSRGVNRTTLP
jgi:hypothetical protein